MEFLFLCHWGFGRFALTERLAVALSEMGHDVLHLVAPVRNPLKPLHYLRNGYPVRSLQLWSPTARRGPTDSISVTLGRAALLLARGLRSYRKTTVVLHSDWLLPLAESLRPHGRVLAAIDEFDGDEASPRPEGSWADAIWCISPTVERLSRARYPDKVVFRTPQGARQLDDFTAPRDPDPTIIYAGSDLGHVYHDTLRDLAKLPARLLLIGWDEQGARRVFGDGVPANVEATGWLEGERFARTIARGWVGVVPYDPNHWRVRHCNPDKVYDYLAAGQAVVSTPISGLRGVPGVTFAGHDDFVGAVREALADCSEEVARRQREIVREFSMNKVARLFLDGLRSGG